MDGLKPFKVKSEPEARVLVDGDTDGVRQTLTCTHLCPKHCATCWYARWRALAWPTPCQAPHPIDQSLAGPRQSPVNTTMHTNPTVCHIVAGNTSAQATLVTCTTVRCSYNASSCPVVKALRRGRRIEEEGRLPGNTCRKATTITCGWCEELLGETIRMVEHTPCAPAAPPARLRQQGPPWTCRVPGHLAGRKSWT